MNALTTRIRTLLMTLLGLFAMSAAAYAEPGDSIASTGNSSFVAILGIVVLGIAISILWRAARSNS